MKLIDQLKVLDPIERVSIKDDNDYEIYRDKILNMPSDFLMQISNYEVYLLDSRREKVLFGFLPDEVTYIIHTIKK